MLSKIKQAHLEMKNVSSYMLPNPFKNEERLVLNAVKNQINPFRNKERLILNAALTHLKMTNVSS